MSYFLAQLNLVLLFYSLSIFLKKMSIKVHFIKKILINIIERQLKVQIIIHCIDRNKNIKHFIADSYGKNTTIVKN